MAKVLFDKDCIAYVRDTETGSEMTLDDYHASLGHDHPTESELREMARYSSGHTPWWWLEGITL